MRGVVDCVANASWPYYMWVRPSRFLFRQATGAVRVVRRARDRAPLSRRLSFKTSCKSRVPMSMRMRQRHCMHKLVQWVQLVRGQTMSPDFSTGTPLQAVFIGHSLRRHVTGTSLGGIEVGLAALGADDEGAAS